MKTFTNQNIMKESKIKNRNIIICLVILIIGIALGVWGYNEIEQAHANAKSLNEIIIDESEDKENKIATVQVNYVPYQFAVQDGNDNSYYIVMDEEYMYIAYMPSGTFNELNREDIKENPGKLEGTTKLTSRAVKELAIEAYNEAVDEDQQITMADFEDYFGNIYLDTTVSGDDDIAVFQEMGCFIFTIAGLIGLIVVIIQKIQFKSGIKKMDEELLEKIDEEVNSESAFYYKKAHLYLTNNYIVNFQSKFSVIEYKDIIWMYSMIFRTNGIKTSQSINVMTKNGKKHRIANIDIVTKTNKEIYEEIWKTIASKNPTMLLGYTKENMNEAKEMIEKE